MTGEFHIHTIHSDGVLTSKEILDYVDNKVDYISITDHDNLDGAIEAYNMKDNYNVKIIIGIEISTRRNDETVHILGYFKDDSNLDLIKENISKIRKARIDRLFKIKDLLREYFNIDLDCTNLVKLSSVTRGSIAREIIKQGYNYTQKELFRSVIGEGCKAFVPASKVEVSEAISWIHNCGGKAVLAHPTLLKKNDVIDIVKLGIDGIEAVYPRNKENDEERFRLIAKENNLFITCGNDFHSFNDPGHADLLTLKLEGKDLERFLEEVL